MGYMCHHHIVVISFHEKDIKKAHARAKDKCGDVVTEILMTPINGYRFFMVGPDGSKEGWSASDKGDKSRENFVDWLNNQAYKDGSNSFSWIYVKHAGEDHEVDPPEIISWG